MTVSEMARGVIATGFEGMTVDTDMPRFGGYVLFARNCGAIAEVRSLTDALRARHGDQTPPLIAIDQEGGSVARLQRDVEPIPSMMALGAAADLELAGRAGEQMAFDLRRAGCTFDFAPVLDLALDPGNTVIGTRSFGSDPPTVAKLGEAFAAGLERGGILSCYKHFPGHGATAVDSHVDLPVVAASEATLRARDLVPFAAVAKHAAAIMGAHVIVPAFDASRPASLSAKIGGDLLRGELGFTGAYVTDCLEMAAVADRAGSVESAVVALCAGADLLLFSHNPELAAAAAEAIERAVQDGRLPLARLFEAHRRVMRLRESGKPPLPVDAFPPHPGVGREIGRRAVTLLRGLPHADPVASCVVSFGTAGEALCQEAPVLESIALPLDPSDDDVERACTALSKNRRRPIVLSCRSHLHASQANAIAAIIDRYADAVVASTREPFDLPLFPEARHLVATYGDNAPSMRGLADVLFSASMPAGELPVDIALGV